MHAVPEEIIKAKLKINSVPVLIMRAKLLKLVDSIGSAHQESAFQIEYCKPSNAMVEIEGGLTKVIAEWGQHLILI